VEKTSRGRAHGRIIPQRRIKHARVENEVRLRRLAP
jgi:hypothetical protein